MVTAYYYRTSNPALRRSQNQTQYQVQVNRSRPLKNKLIKTRGNVNMLIEFCTQNNLIKRRFQELF